MTARVEPVAGIARARVVFRAAGTPAWYFVEMSRANDVFRGTLPKPLKGTNRIEYYIDAVDRAMGELRTAEYASAVVGRPGECPSKMLTAAVLTSAKLTVGSLASGAAAVPAGFSGTGILGGSVAGASAAGSGGAAAGGGALKTLLIVTGAAAAAGGAALAVSQAAEDDVVTKSYAVEGFAVSLFPRLPHAGAVVSSSLDSVTTTTDAQGHFRLVPSTPCLAKKQPRGDSGGVVFTVRILAPGCPPFSETKQWGCDVPGRPVGDVNMNCPGVFR